MSTMFTPDNSMLMLAEGEVVDRVIVPKPGLVIPLGQKERVEAYDDLIFVIRCR